MNYLPMHMTPVLWRNRRNPGKSHSAISLTGVKCIALMNYSASLSASFRLYLMPMKSLLPTLFGCTGLALLSLSIAAAAPGTGPSFEGPIGLQLYSLREQLKKDVPGTLDEVKSWGIKYVELAGTYGLPPEQFKAELDKRGIVPISAHFPYEKYRDDIESIASEAKALGLKYAGCAWITHE